ncbi:MAG: succinate dehydrogenase cytochrome b subunit [Crocinitomicaceae bacterium]|jgi:succinate dehydrogenase / fumarate reductase cytochrome b subunit|tara:strand:- start:56 stop:1018 length:963 start_codon:yes stop_codon:yes gene_type:complete
MSKSAFIKSSIAKKYWMALTGLFLCLFLVGHLLGNLQLIFSTGEEGRRVFNEYAFFMTTNPAVKALSYLTYFSILFHAIDGIALLIQNKKARPIPYAYSKPSENSSLPSRYMALLGTLVLVFIATHMSNFWWKMKYTEEIPLHSYYSSMAQDTMYLTQKGEQISLNQLRMVGTTEGSQLIMKADKVNKLIEANFSNQINSNVLDEDELAELELAKNNQLVKKDEVLGEGYRDLHTVVSAFFSKNNKSESGVPLGLLGMLFYVVSMAVMAFHLWHGFASAFQSLGLNHPKFTPIIQLFGKGFAIVVPLLFAIIPVFLYLIS